MESCQNRVIAMFSETATLVFVEHYTVQERINGRLGVAKASRDVKIYVPLLKKIVGIPLFKFYSFKKQFILNSNSVFSLDIRLKPLMHFIHPLRAAELPRFSHIDLKM